MKKTYQLLLSCFGLNFAPVPTSLLTNECIAARVCDFLLAPEQVRTALTSKVSYEQGAELISKYNDLYLNPLEYRGGRVTKEMEGVIGSPYFNLRGTNIVVSKYDFTRDAEGKLFATDVPHGPYSIDAALEKMIVDHNARLVFGSLAARDCLLARPSNMDMNFARQIQQPLFISILYDHAMTELYAGYLLEEERIKQHTPGLYSIGYVARNPVDKSATEPVISFTFSTKINESKWYKKYWDRGSDNECHMPGSQCTLEEIKVWGTRCFKVDKVKVPSTWRTINSVKEVLRAYLRRSKALGKSLPEAYEHMYPSSLLWYAMEYAEEREINSWEEVMAIAKSGRVRLWPWAPEILTVVLNAELVS